MSNILKNKEYTSIVKDILDNENFKMMDTINHHGTTRMKHCIRVSYYSYKVGKKLKLHTKELARAGLLHDYFMSYPDRTKLERFLSTFIHPKYAVINAERDFEINKMEHNIIRAHMFPVNPALPIYLESWLVSTVDKVVGLVETVRYFLGIEKKKDSK